MILLYNLIRIATSMLVCSLETSGQIGSDKDKEARIIKQSSTKTFSSKSNQIRLNSLIRSDKLHCVIEFW